MDKEETEHKLKLIELLILISGILLAIRQISENIMIGELFVFSIVFSIIYYVMVSNKALLTSRNLFIFVIFMTSIFFSASLGTVIGITSPQSLLPQSLIAILYYIVFVPFLFLALSTQKMIKKWVKKPRNFILKIKNSRFFKKEISSKILWPIIATVSWVILIIFGVILTGSLMPDELPLYSYVPTNDTSIKFILNCDRPSDVPKQTFLQKGDVLDCWSWFISNEPLNLTLSSTASLFYPSRLEIDFQYKDFQNISNKTLIRYDRLELNETEQYTFISVIHTQYTNIELERSYLLVKFNVYSSEEILQRRINTISLFIILMTASFGIFTGVSHLKSMFEDAIKNKS